MNELVESAALVETCCLCKIFACLWICNNNVMDFHIFFSILFSSNDSISIASLHRLIPSMIPFFITVYVCLIAGAFPNTYHLVFASRKCRTHSFTTAQNPFAVMSHIRILSILIKMLCLFSLSPCVFFFFIHFRIDRINAYIICYVLHMLRVQFSLKDAIKPNYCVNYTLEAWVSLIIPVPA